MNMKLWAASQTGKAKTELDWQNRNITPLSEMLYSGKNSYEGFPELGEWHKGNEELTKQNTKAIRDAATPEELKILDWKPNPLVADIHQGTEERKQQDQIYKKYYGELKLPGEYSNRLGRPGWANPQSDVVKQQQNDWNRQQATRM